MELIGSRGDGNTIYDNETGMLINHSGGSSGNTSSASNNMVYKNGVGVQVGGSISVTLTNNSIYQTTGNAIHAPALVGILNMTNNIVSVNTGTAVSLPLGGTSITSNYNLFDLRGAGKIANWKGTQFDALSTWAIRWESIPTVCFRIHSSLTSMAPTINSDLQRVILAKMIISACCRHRQPLMPEIQSLRTRTSLHRTGTASTWARLVIRLVPARVHRKPFKSSRLTVERNMSRDNKYS